MIYRIDSRTSLAVASNLNCVFYRRGVKKINIFWPKWWPREKKVFQKMIKHLFALKKQFISVSSNDKNKVIGGSFHFYTVVPRYSRWFCSLEIHQPRIPNPLFYVFFMQDLFCLLFCPFYKFRSIKRKVWKHRKAKTASMNLRLL